MDLRNNVKKDFGVVYLLTAKKSYERVTPFVGFLSLICHENGGNSSALVDF